MKNKIIIAFLLVLMVLPAMAFDSSKIVVAIIDTGIDTTNQYISRHVKKNGFKSPY